MARVAIPDFSILQSISLQKDKKIIGETLPPGFLTVYPG
jgi:hypothetical protein